MEFLIEAPIDLKIFWYVAIFASCIFLIQTILTFIGMDSSDGTAADFDGNLDGDGMPFQLFTFRNLINFMLGFGWTGIALYKQIDNSWILIFVASLVGFGFVVMFFLLLKSISKLEENNSFTYQKLINQTGEVYLRIPPKGKGKGKILISVQGAFHELDAVSEEMHIIDKGKPVKVMRIEGNNLLVVKSI